MQDGVGIIIETIFGQVPTGIGHENCVRFQPFKARKLVPIDLHIHPEASCVGGTMGEAARDIASSLQHVNRHNVDTVFQQPCPPAPPASQEVLMVVCCQGRAVTNGRLSQHGTLPGLDVIDLGFSAL